MKEKLKSLDLLKGIGILMVIMVHNRHFIMKDMTGLRQLINYGQMGCQLFFMVSGMALCYAWYHMAERYDNGMTPKNRILCSVRFILRRYRRLAPGFLIILCVNFGLNVLFLDVLDHSPGFIMNRTPAAIATNVLFLHGLFPDYINDVFPGGWYIGTTFLLYILFPLVLWLFEKLYALHFRLITVLPAVFLVLALFITDWITQWSHGELYMYNNSFLYYLFTNQLPCFSLGILLYFQEKKHFSRRCPLLLCTALFLLTGFISVRLYLIQKPDTVFGYLPSAAGLSFYWFAVCFLHIEQTTAKNFSKQKVSEQKVSEQKVSEQKVSNRKITSRKNSNRMLNGIAGFLASCGKNSYGMYLVHAFISWYGMKDLTYFLTLNGYEYNDLALYALLYVPSVFVIYVAGLYMGKLLTLTERSLRRKS